MPFQTGFLACIFRPTSRAQLGVLLLAGCSVAPLFAFSGQTPSPGSDTVLAATPPMGWNDWAHYECDYTAQTILDNAKLLVKTGLAARGYNTVTIDDCWMQKTRDKHGNLQVDPKRFPNGMRPVARAIHKLGLKFGIYEDAGYATCGGFAGSGKPNGGGADHFVQDTRLFASWGVDYLKLDGCNVFVPKGSTQESAYKTAYATQSAALQKAGRPIVFSESAPAYFQDTPQWYDVLTWVRGYGQLWREGTDIAVFDRKKPDASRLDSILGNYAYNLPLGRFQSPGNWNDADFIIGGDSGVNLAETRSQVALWSMMSAPLILSSDLSTLSPRAIAILGNKAIIAVDQDPMGHMATLVRRTPKMDVLFKPLVHGEYAMAVLNRSNGPITVTVRPKDLGFSNLNCHVNARNLWTGRTSFSAALLQATVAPHDTEIWRIQPSAGCGTPNRIGAITMISTGNFHGIENYGRCLYSTGKVDECMGTPQETWTLLNAGILKSGGKCLGVSNGHPVMQSCTVSNDRRWKYTLAGNLIDLSTDECLTAVGADTQPQRLGLQSCGHNLPNQIWSLPN